MNCRHFPSRRWASCNMRRLMMSSWRAYHNALNKNKIMYNQIIYMGFISLQSYATNWKKLLLTISPYYTLTNFKWHSTNKNQRISMNKLIRNWFWNLWRYFFNFFSETNWTSCSTYVSSSPKVICSLCTYMNFIYPLCNIPI